MLQFEPNPLAPVRFFDRACLTGHGHFAADHPNGRRRLFFRLYLLRSRPRGPLHGPLGLLSPIPDVDFEIRPDLPHSLIGRDRWAAFLGAVGMTYQQAYAAPGMPIRPLFLGMRLSMHWIALDRPNYPSRGLGLIEPLALRVGLHPDLNPSAAILGADLLHHGMVAWSEVDNSSYFFRANCGPNSANRIEIANGYFRNPAPTAL